MSDLANQQLQGSHVNHLSNDRSKLWKTPLPSTREPQDSKPQPKLLTKKLLLGVEKNPSCSQSWNRFRYRNLQDGSLPTFEEILSGLPTGYTVAKVTVSIEVSAVIPLDELPGFNPYTSYIQEEF